MSTYVNTYLISQMWGGPEEGGWWYDQGVPIESVRTENHISTLQDGLGAKDVRQSREEWCERENAERPPAHMSHSTGVYAVRIEDSFAQPYPVERPHYE